jgi:hypothetical protein
LDFPQNLLEIGMPYDDKEQKDRHIGMITNFVWPLAHGLFGLAANPIAKSYGWKRYLKKWASPTMARSQLEKYGLP